jgi:hypothetical protein
MKLSLSSFLLSALIIDCRAFLSPSARGSRVSTVFEASNDAAFSAFADSLEEEPEKTVEKSWQAKVEDLLDPQTNLADVR